MATYKSKIIADAGIQLPAQSVDKVMTIDSSGNIVSSTVTTAELASIALVADNIAEYIQNFIISDWVIDGSEYKIEIPESTHLKGIHPTLIVYETVSSINTLTNVSETIDNTGLVTIRVIGSPDLRFNGLITIL